MGGTNWSDEHYSKKMAHRAASGTPTFAYDAATKRSPHGTWTAHATLDPKVVAGTASPFAGKIMREACDSSAHPNSRAVAVLFDVTGSMHEVPMILQKKLPGLMGLLLRKGYLEDPQILFGAIGDATYDKVPLQIGQFESGIEMEEHLTNFVLEGGGGGQRTESYELGMYFLAHHTALDCWTKRGQRAYAFFVGDEMPYNAVKRLEVESLIGDKPQADIPTEQVIEELKERYELFYIMPKGTAHSGEKEILDTWKKLLGSQNVLELDDAANVCETIALSIGICEGKVNISEAGDHLEDAGLSRTAAGSVSTALAPLSARGVPARGGSGANLPEPVGSSPEIERL